MTGLEVEIAKQSSGLLEKGLKFLPNIVKSIDERVKYNFREAHLQYCANVIKKYCRSRTFFIRSEPQFLKDFYVPASILKNRRQRIDKANLSTLSKISKKCIVTGSGGSGKTIFMRHLLLDAIERDIGYPIFVELRNLNDANGASLEKLICDSMRHLGFSLGDKYVLRSLKDGLLVVLLDGFDEVVLSKRRELELEIKKLGSTTKSQIVISSRPDIVLEGWDDFATVQIAPLELDEACELIEKINFNDDDEVKERFVQRLRDGLFESHRYFLSNPLLLSIMLLTYGDSADIPRKFSSFYEQAYAALFQKHDALKSGFRRERRTNLDIYEFSRLFSAFSAITYNKRMFRFALTDAIASVKQAMTIARSRDIDPAGFLDDAKQAVCLLVEDGLDLAYVHRSFQEYFVAKFINDAEDSIQKDYIRNVSRAREEIQFQQDNVLKFLYEINPAIVEDNYLVPALKKLFGKESNKKLSYSSWRTIFKKAVSSIQNYPDINRGFSFTVNNWDAVSVIFFMSSNCLPRSTKSRSASRTPTGGRQETRKDLEDAFNARGEVVLRDLPARSGVWRHLAGSAGSLSLDSLEAMRVEFNKMIERSATRAETVGTIFDFSGASGGKEVRAKKT